MSALVETQIKPFYETRRFTLFCGDCRSVLPTLDACSVDSIVCDPPYELGFMGKGWDRSGIAYDAEVWRECLRVLKPGGHLLAFGGSRTYHRLACAIEDAGFEIRDQVQYVYGSGFPKSLDVSKAIDANLRVERRPLGERKGAASANTESLGMFRATYQNTIATSWAARQWDGWGTGLKPAHEPIALARKPLCGTVAENVLRYGTGGLHIDACRIELQGQPKTTGGCSGTGAILGGGIVERVPEDNSIGRWPANLIHDGSDEVLAVFPNALGQQRSTQDDARSQGLVYGVINRNGTEAREPRDDFGSAARFFYCAKADQVDRNEGCEDLPYRVADEVHKRPRTELDDPRRHGVTPRQNNHPTVKPTELMRYLCRLITPPGGTVLDPFTGSGSTGKAAMLEGLRFIGIELSEDYCQLAQRRIEAVTRQGMLFT